MQNDDWQKQAQLALSKQVLQKPEALVFEGGGVLGIAYPSALRVASDRGALENARKFGGASAGSLIAAMLACKADVDYLEREIESTDYSKFFDSTFGVVRDAYRFYSRGGYAQGHALRSKIGKTMWDLTGDENITFAEIEQRFGNQLSVVATSMTERRSLIFDAQKTPQQPVADALLASSSYPLVFPLVDYYDPIAKKSHKLWDGGLLNNFPIQLFDEQQEVSIDQPQKRWPNINGTVGFKLMQPDEHIPTQGESAVQQRFRVDNVFDAASGLLACWSDASARVHLDNTLDWPRTLPIRIPQKISVMNFSLGKEQKDMLRKAGHDSAVKYFDKD